MKPWVLYTRVSTSKQADRGASLEAQLAACTALAKAHDYPTLHIADEGESAKDVAQPGLARARAMAAAGEISGLIVYKLDRVARNTRGLLDLLDELGRNGVQFTSVREHIDTSGAAGRLIVTVLAALAQFEREQLLERMKATNDHRREQGAWVAGSAPIGLAIEQRGKLRFLIPHPVFGAPVARAWAMVLEGRSLREVGTFLQGAGVPTSSAKRAGRGVWARNAVSAMLRNPTYVGHLVEADDHAKVRALLGARARPGQRRPAVSSHRTERIWRLQGVARCAYCDSAMVGTGAQGRGGHAYHYYRCSGRIHRGKAFCSAMELSAGPWEDRVVAKLSDYLRDRAGLIRDVQAAIAKKLADSAPVLERLQRVTAERDELQARIDRILDLATSGGASARAVAPRLSKLQASLEEAQTAVAEAEGALAGVTVPLASLEATAGLLAGCTERLGEESEERQQQVLQALAVARIGRGKRCSIEVSIPYLPQAQRLVRTQASGKLPHPAAYEPSAPLAVVQVEIAEPPRAPRRWYRRPAGAEVLTP